MDKDIINNVNNINSDMTPMQYHAIIIVATLVSIATVAYYIFSGNLIPILLYPSIIVYILLADKLGRIEEHKAIFNKATEYTFIAMIFVIGALVNLTLIPHMEEILLKQPNSLRYIFFMITSFSFLIRELIALDLYKKSK